jgi:EAL domain-containing protein (putative c-di-GMP-specific phosphodiesterase class I)/GGDEF domain-containing protein
MTAASLSISPHHARALEARATFWVSSLVLVTAVAAVTIVLCLVTWTGHAALAAATFAALLAVAFLAARAMVRRATTRFLDFTQSVERIAGEGGGTIEVRPGDEFEPLANAFNSMSARLEASMRRIQEIAFVDPVTQLPNHNRFQREIDASLLAARTAPTPSAVAVFNLGRMERMLQSAEPHATREIARAIAARFSLAARNNARIVCAGRAVALSLARLGPNEFGAFTADLSGDDTASLFQRITAALNEPFNIDGQKLVLGAFCGFALYPRDGRDAETLVGRARMAANVAEIEPSRTKMFTNALGREVVARTTLEREMRGALERNEFRAYFQPKLSMRTGRIEGCEALARWERPDRTIVGPNRFIPIAQESGLLSALSDAILREACWKAAAWARAGYPAKLAVNVSATQLMGARFAESVLHATQQAGLSPSNLELEITESVAMEDPDLTAQVLKPLREAGVRLAIDDFGCGHSSLAALSRLPFDVIKIDRQFVRALERGDTHAGAIVDMILALARTLDMEVVAEGVERREEAEFLAARGCHWAQGFLYGAAVTAGEFTELLRRQAEDEVQVSAA